MQWKPTKNLTWECSDLKPYKMIAKAVPINKKGKESVEVLNADGTRQKKFEGKHVLDLMNEAESYVKSLSEESRQ